MSTLRSAKQLCDNKPLHSIGRSRVSARTTQTHAHIHLDRQADRQTRMWTRWRPETIWRHQVSRASRT